MVKLCIDNRESNKRIESACQFFDDKYDVEYDDDEDDGEETKVSARDLYMETMQKANIIKSQDANTEEKDDGDDDDMTFTVITRD
jgi:hypothetical protein